MARATILVVDDDPRGRASTRSIFEGCPYEILEAGTLREAKGFLDRRIDLVLLDIGLPDGRGFDLLAAMRSMGVLAPVIALSGDDDPETILRASRAGVVRFLRKGRYDPAELQRTVDDLLNSLQNRPPAAAIGNGLKRLRRRMIGMSPATDRVHQAVLRAAEIYDAVLLLGESGVGKDLAARWIHKLSGRSRRPFVEIHCATIPEPLLESELFGHVRGSFTGADATRRGRIAQANGGTLFLNEVGDLPEHFQGSLLEFTDTHVTTPLGGKPVRVDARLIAATNRDLPELVRSGQFRRDLYHRLSVCVIRLPPLRDRDRARDVIPLAAYFLRRARRRYGRGPIAFSSEAVDLLLRYGWPGNVRELENAIKTAVGACHGSRIDGEHLPEEVRNFARRRALADGGKGSFLVMVEEEKRRRMLAALEKAEGNITRASEIAGVSRSTFYEWCRKFGP